MFGTKITNLSKFSQIYLNISWYYLLVLLHKNILICFVAISRNPVLRRDSLVKELRKMGKKTGLVIISDGKLDCTNSSSSSIS